jgi:predicted nucleic acid-binding Zn ribbon protein
MAPYHIETFLCDRIPDMTDELGSELGRQLVARRRIVESSCAVCGTAISGTVRRKYCSNRCRVAAYTERKREQRAKEAE